MYNRYIATALPELGKWCAYALVLLAPGSFIIVPVWWLVRQRFSPKRAAGVN
jgi:hypothetical protein